MPKYRNTSNTFYYTTYTETTAFPTGETFELTDDMKGNEVIKAMIEDGTLKAASEVEVSTPTPATATEPTATESTATEPTTPIVPQDV